jgi:Mn-dependent DtxR family transcriptional regulator
MNKTISDAVLTNLAPRTYYRACDVAEEMRLGTPTVGAALRELARGGVIERFKEKNRVVYITKQERLF